MRVLRSFWSHHPPGSLMLSFVLATGACSTTNTPGPASPTMPPVFDQMIVLGQRVGPVSLGMTADQLTAAVGKADSDHDYGGDSRGIVYQKLKLDATLAGGHVVVVAPDDPAYATAGGLHIGSPASDVAKVDQPSQQRTRSTETSTTASPTARSS